ncbi:unnamed protein product [Didymodactylos carnosus]|uniref:Uncharacterized protein n=2 Tax=Didymodactylos carnosus TaxID=1234261 RepID=A0A8S2EW37_9BILA|nr:unnamed protein product [Didymodactylos carnosus]CAF4140382.1 unnamed protein product [Didymodactylos carnosus]
MSLQGNADAAVDDDPPLNIQAMHVPIPLPATVTVNRTISSLYDHDADAEEEENNGIWRHVAICQKIPEFRSKKQMTKSASTKKSSMSADEIKELHKEGIRAIIKDSRGFGDLTKDGMKHYIQKLRPGYSPPSRQYVARHLKKMVMQYSRSQREELTHVDHINVTTELNATIEQISKYPKNFEKLNFFRGYF